MTPDPAVRVRAAFTEVSLGLMSWEDPAEITPRCASRLSAQEYRRLELVRQVYRPYDPQGEVEPFDVNADWEDTGN